MTTTTHQTGTKKRVVCRSCDEYVALGVHMCPNCRAFGPTITKKEATKKLAIIATIFFVSGIVFSFGIAELITIITTNAFK